MTGTRSSRAPDAWPLRFKRRRHPREGGCNPIGFNEYGHDSAITFSRHPGAGRDPCFHKHLSLIASATVSHRTAPRRLHYGSRPAPGWLICSEGAMKANWITASKAGIHVWHGHRPSGVAETLMSALVYACRVNL